MIHYQDLIGVEYRNGGRDPNQGLDCFGVVMLLLARCGVLIEDVQGYPEDWDLAGLNLIIENFHRPWRAVEKPYRAGDVLIVQWPNKDRPTHLAVVVDGMRVVHAVKTQRVCVWRISKISPYIYAAARHEELT